MAGWQWGRLVFVRGPLFEVNVTPYYLLFLQMAPLPWIYLKVQSTRSSSSSLWTRKW